MSKTYDSKKGFAYCITVKTAPCTITTIGKNGLSYTLLQATTAGQYYIIAPYYEITISQDDAIYTEVSEGAELNNVTNITNINGKTDNSLKVVNTPSVSSLATLIQINGLSCSYFLSSPITGQINWGNILSYPINSSKVDSLYIFFKIANDSFPVIQWPTNEQLKWVNGNPPIINLNGEYMLVIMQTANYAIANLAYSGIF